MIGLLINLEDYLESRSGGMVVSIENIIISHLQYGSDLGGMRINLSKNNKTKLSLIIMLAIMAILVWTKVI